MLAFVAFEKITQTFQLFEVVWLPSVGVGVGDVSNYFSTTGTCTMTVNLREPQILLKCILLCVFL